MTNEACGRKKTLSPASSRLQPPPEASPFATGNLSAFIEEIEPSSRLGSSLEHGDPGAFQETHVHLFDNWTLATNFAQVVRPSAPLTLFNLLLGLTSEFSIGKWQIVCSSILSSI